MGAQTNRVSAMLTSKAQLTLPAAVRRRLGVGPGDRLDFVFYDDRVEVTPVRGTLSDLKGLLPKPKRPVSLAAMEATIEREAGR